MRLLITADIHGSIDTWLTLQTLITPKDGLVVAGDLFDTCYGRYGHPDFAPETIRQDLSVTSRPFFYVYGNCDVPSFFPGHEHAMTFTAGNRKIFLHHGSPPVEIAPGADIVIQGHTHVCALEREHGRIFMNPGSITRPQKGPPTYGILDDTGIRVIVLQSGDPLMSLNW